MSNRLYKFMISGIVLLSVVLIFSYQAQAKRSKLSVQPAAPRDSNVPEKTAAEKPKASGAAPNIKFDTVVHDFCDVSPDSVNTCKFGFKNTGRGTLEITQTKGTCKCTVPDLQKKVYAPGEAGEISVQFHAPTYQGPTSQNIFVSSNDPENPRVELTIRAHVQSQVRVTPESMNLSLIDANNAGAVAITLKSIDNERFAVTGIASEGNVFTVDFDPNNISDTHTLYPKVNIENLRKYLGGYLVFAINHPHCGSVRVQYNCLREFETSPAVIIIRDAVPDQNQTRTVYLISNYNQPIEIESITSEKGIVKVVGQEQTENRFKIDVNVLPPPKEGQSRVFSDVLHIKIKGKEQIDIQCRGFYKLGQ